MIKAVWKLGDTDITDAMAIRNEVFVIEQNVPSELEWDDIDKISKHVIAYSDETPVGTARLYIDPSDTVDDLSAPLVLHLGRLAVLKEFRGQHIGDFIVRTVLFSAFDFDGADVVEISAQIQAIGFYEKFGFQKFGDEYDDAGIRHIAMKVTKNNVILSNCGKHENFSRK